MCGRILLSDQELSQIEKWKKAGVLAPIEPDLLPKATGIILITCGDCHQISDILGHQRGLWQEKISKSESEALVHILALNGGGLRLVANSALNQGLSADEILLRDITATRILKNIHTIGILGHFPCGAARSLSWDLEKVMSDLFEAKRRVRERNPDANVFTYIHVDHNGGEKCRTYGAKRTAWEKWLKER